MSLTSPKYLNMLSLSELTLCLFSQLISGFGLITKLKFSQSEYIFLYFNRGSQCSYVRLVVKIHLVGGSPGLVVMGGDSCCDGRGFKSQHCILD